MITVTHCPLVGLFLAHVQRPYGSVEFNYKADGKLAFKGETIAYTRKEYITKPAVHVVAVSDISAAVAENKARLWLSKNA